AALTVDHCDESAVVPTDVRYERRQRERNVDADTIRYRLCQREHPKDVVLTRREDGQPARAVPVELIFPEAPQTLEVGTDRLLAPTTLPDRVFLELREDGGEACVEISP